MNWKRSLLRLAIGTSLGVASMASAQVLNPSNGHYYQVVSAVNSLSWLNARTAAAGMTYQGMAGHLATITSTAENAFLVTTFTGSALSGKDIGGVQAQGSTEPAAGWTWLTGEPFSYSNWDAGEPNNGAGGNAENALQFAWDQSNGTWNDIDASAVSGSFGGTPFFTGYVVEFEAVPEPGAGLMAGLGSAVLLLARKRFRA